MPIQNWQGIFSLSLLVLCKCDSIQAFSSVTSDRKFSPVTSLKHSSKIRPLHQNWWPVTIKASVDKNRPNPIDLLGKKLVLWHDGEVWICLDDRCSHRFAPLSEGRVINATEDSEKKQSRCLQCAYHGWEFNNDGSCTRIPQASAGSDARKSSQARVRKYPVREGGGMLWVWADPDPDSFLLSKSLQLPISPLLQRYCDEGDESNGFMRDLPYGMEYLGENLLDLSHLPFSHHSVGGLKRDLGGPLPFHMLSAEERKENNEIENEHAIEGTAVSNPVPLLQAELEDAGIHDPIFLSMAAQGVQVSNATTTVAFHEPSHVRYWRNRGPGTSSTTELFLCPTTPGKSRVILFNTFEPFLKPKPGAPKPKRKGLIESFKTYMIKRMTKSSTWKIHMLSHQIFDGDGIFLHKQGDRVQRSKLNFRDYYTPTAADVLVNSFRRWLDSAAKATSEFGDEGISAAAAATGGFNGANDSQIAYLDNEPRDQMLDRYQSHTATCKICRSAVEKFEKKKIAMELALPLFLGASGAAGVLLVNLMLSPSGITTKAGRNAAMALISFALGSVVALKERKKLQETINKFYFEDYIHADKH